MAINRETKKNFSKTLISVFQRLPGFILISLIIIAFVGPLYFPDFYWAVTISVYVFLLSNGVRLATGLAITAMRTKKHTETDWKKRYEECIKDNLASSNNFPVSYEQVFHVIVIPNYKEEFETLCETLDTLAVHSCASEKYKIILAMEQGEKDSPKKAERLIKLFSKRFLSMKYTVHPTGIAGEARGKSSNVAWAAVEYAKNWMDDSLIRNEIFTVMDADTQLTEKYFECMTFKYCTSTAEEQERTMFAPVLIFDRNSQQVPFPVRVADISWSIGLMANFQIPVRFPCSCYSVSILLARRVNFWDAGPEAIGEDFHMAAKCMTATQMALRLLPLYIPASCSNVQADTYMSSIWARFQQSKRHLWGLLDFSYICARLITHKCWTSDPFKSALAAYILFEIFYQPFFGFYHMPGLYLFPSSKTPFGVAILAATYYIRLSLIPSAIVVAISYERYHYVCCTYRARIREQSQFGRFSQEQLIDEEAGNETPVVENYRPSEVAFRPWYGILDWAALPICLILFYMIPGINAMFAQMISNKLDYQVSLKPTTRVTTDQPQIENSKEQRENDEEKQPIVMHEKTYHNVNETVSFDSDSFISANEAPGSMGKHKNFSFQRDSGLDLDDIVTAA